MHPTLFSNSAPPIGRIGLVSTKKRNSLRLYGLGSSSKSDLAAEAVENGQRTRDGGERVVQGLRMALSAGGGIPTWNVGTRRD